METHKNLLNDKFSHSKEDLLYNSGGNVMWSLFRTQSDGVAIYYHETDDFHIMAPNKAKFHSLAEIADGWNPNAEVLEIN